MNDEEYLRLKSEEVKEGSVYDKEYFDPVSGKSSVSNYGSYSMNNWFIKQSIRFSKVFGCSKVLDIGCAKGFIVKSLRDCGFDAYGIDISDYAINNSYESVKPYLTRMSVEDLNKEKVYGLVICMEVLEHIKDLKGALVKIYNSITNPGFLWVSVPFYANGKPVEGDDKTHVNFLSKNEWISVIESVGFKYKSEVKVGVGIAGEMSVRFGVEQCNINELVFLKSESNNFKGFGV